VRIVQVVRRADADEVDAVGAAPQLLEMTVEPLDLGEEARVEPEAVEHADGVMRIGGGNQLVARILDGFQVAGGHEARGTGQGKVHGDCQRNGSANPAGR
jgi:hypothetical protein